MSTVPSGHPSIAAITLIGDPLICWIVTNAFGTRAYLANNALGTLSTYDLSDPRKPVEMAASDLKGHGHLCQLALSSGEDWLYIVRRRLLGETMIGSGGVLNVLKITPDGLAQEFDWSPVTIAMVKNSPARQRGCQMSRLRSAVNGTRMSERLGAVVEEYPAAAGKLPWPRRPQAREPEC